MRDYLEELLEALPQEEEQEPELQWAAESALPEAGAAGWEADCAGLPEENGMPERPEAPARPAPGPEGGWEAERPSPSAREKREKWERWEAAEPGWDGLPEARDSRRPALLGRLQALERAALSVRGGDAPGRSLGADVRAPAGPQPLQRDRPPEPAGELSVQAVDRAFQRDSRRYDRGFSLYG